MSDVIRLCCCVSAAVLLILPAEAHADEEHHVPPNHAALFVGVTNLETEGHRTNEFTLAAEYEVRLPFAHQTFGVGPILEVAMGEETVMSSIGTAYVHPWHGIKLFAGAGIERANGENHPMLRGGIAYDVHLHNGACITPMGGVDRVEAHNVWIGGVTVGYGF